MNLKEFYERYVCLNLEDYSNIGIDFEINKFLIIVLFALVIAAVILNINRYLVSVILNKLIRHEAIGEENAKTLGELGVMNFGTRFILNTNSRLRRIISIVGVKSMSYEEYRQALKEKKKEEKVDYETAKLYIPEDKSLIQGAKDITSQRTSSPLNTALICVFIASVFICLILLMPEILTLINNIL